LGRIGEQQPGGWTYHHGDALGSVRQLSDPTGAITLAQSYAPYGETLSSTGDGVSFYQYTGEMRDASGLTYLRARYMNSRVGRFISRDTWRGNYQRPMSYNRWLYGYANPIAFIDPTGYYSCQNFPAKDIATCLKIRSGMGRPEGSVGFLADSSDETWSEEFGIWFHYLLETIPGYWTNREDGSADLAWVIGLGIAVEIANYMGVQDKEGSDVRNAFQEAFLRKGSSEGFYDMMGSRQAVRDLVKYGYWGDWKDPECSRIYNGTIFEEEFRKQLNNRKNNFGFDNAIELGKTILEAQPGLIEDPNRPWEWGNIQADDPVWFREWIQMTDENTSDIHGTWLVVGEGIGKEATLDTLYVHTKNQKYALCGLKRCLDMTDADEPLWVKEERRTNR